MHAVIASLILASAYALPEISISKRDANLQTSNVARGLLKRQGTVETNVYDILAYSTGGAYYANVTVGTPPQNQVVIVDTGSSDLYFDASTAATCQTTGPYSCRGGTFTPNNSSTYHVVDQSPAFNTSFGDGSTAVGPFAQDVIGIGDVFISNVQFGVADQVNSTTGYAIGLIGIGYSENEATQIQYPNIPEVLASAGLIASRLYSIYLNDESQISGSILFGGIDKSKYTGELVTVDFLPDLNTGIIDQSITVVTALNVTTGGKTASVLSGGIDGINAYRDSSSLPVLLDTGSSAWSVPTRFYDEAIAPLFTYVQQGACSCSHRNSGDSVTVTFAGKQSITVPATEFIVPLYNATTDQPIPYGDGTNACAFMIAPGPNDGTGFYTLGDAILRSMYLVYDLDNGQVSLAQAAVNSTAAPNIVAVSAGPSGIAKAISTSYSSAPTPTFSIAAPVNSGASFSVSTGSSTIGAATGTAAVPADAQVPSGSVSGATSGTSGTAAHSSSAAAARGGLAPGFEWRLVWAWGAVVLGMAVGMGLMI